ncbi:hypothetical protein KUTeg_000801 [Tegillarca granosa]|uniref:Uncharacterized protein n=1 Tax=Tegillarca granosa TaxID=220873 RepID=A0ABQ9G1F3_TEGGR|nr:hypothetical protein KUTeg_000801 [Tegillarca granosa]
MLGIMPYHYLDDFQILGMQKYYYSHLTDINQFYEDIADEVHYRHVSLRTFQRLWHELFPHISVMQPLTDLKSVSGGLDEEEKQQLIIDYNGHIAESKENFNNLGNDNKLTGNVAASLDTCMHYSWDYAQTVHYPHHAQQSSPIYFKTPRKCHVFGTFYLVNEAENPGKGPNAVVSFVHHYFACYDYGEKDACIHFDNCGLHRKLQLSMMVAGHTIFEPDWHFGI